MSGEKVRMKEADSSSRVALKWDKFSGSCFDRFPTLRSKAGKGSKRRQYVPMVQVLTVLLGMKVQ